MDKAMKRLLTYSLVLILAVHHSVFASEFRFSPRTNKAHLIQWRAWGPEALAEAKSANKPVLLSLSAVWCHWCHVMDETTYSDPGIIAHINEHFIPVRVDADMRPDIDGLYNQGGWPSTVILTPEGEVVAGGNYIPPAEMLVRLKQAAELFAADREGIAARIKQTGELRALQEAGMKGSPDKGDIESITSMLKSNFDEQNGGFGTGEKFPNPHAADFLLSVYAKGGDGDVKRVITKTLDGMAKGALFDKIEGGFFRYATKQDWSAPHYEKMLDVNAGLIKNYAGAHLLFAEKEYRRIVVEAVEYVRATLYDKESGAFFGSQDADESYYGELDRKGMRVPAVDRTSYADSSSLMISALVAASGAAGEKKYLDMATKGAAFILEKLYSGEDGVFHYYRDGTAHLPGLLSDNALFGSALLDLYNATGERSYLTTSRKIGALVMERFYDKGAKQFRSSLGTAVPKPVTAGMLSDVNHNLANYRTLQFLGRLLHVAPSENMKAARDAALMTFSGEYSGFTPHAAAYGIALLRAFGTPVEITILGDGPKVREYLSIANSLYIPEKVVRVLSFTRDAKEIRKRKYPLKEAAYLCAGKRCSKPINEPGKFKEELRRFLEKPVRN